MTLATIADPVPLDADSLAEECAALRRRVAELEAERASNLVHREQQVAALTAANTLNRDIVQSAHEGIVVYGPDLRYQAWNPFMEKLTNIRAADILGKHPLEVFPFLSDVGILARVEQALAGELPEPLEAEVSPAGIPRWVVDTNAPLRDEAGRIIGVIATIQDVTERRRAEEALKASENRLKLALKSSDIAVWDWNVRTNEMVWDEEMLRLYGVTPTALSAGVEVWRQGLHPEDRERAIAEVQAAFDGTREFDTEFRVVSPAGEVRYLKADGLVLRDDTGAPIRMLGLNRDITGRKRAEEMQRKLAARLTDVLESIGDAFMAMDHALIVTYFNAAAERMLGRRREDVLGKYLFDAFPEAKGSIFDEKYHYAARTQETLFFEVEFGVPPYENWYDVRVFPNAEGISVFFQVTTERKRAAEEKARLEAQLHHSQKMEAIGTLAGGVAHDFNNILGGLLGGLSLLELELDDAGEAVRSEISDMKEQVKRGANLAKQLLGLSRRGKYDVRALDLATVTKKTGTIFGHARRDVTIEYDFATNLQAVLMDHTQLEQVLLNLFVNAGQAMPNGGQLTIRADNVTVNEEQAAIDGLQAGKFVELIVADTGIGMDAATQARIFEPFFTTKAPGQGTGLGLASVYGIVKNHGGSIQVESEVGKGATFTILLPATPLAAAETPAPTAIRPAGHGTILVVDDEEVLLKSCARLLRFLGYDVLTASGGRAAIEQVREHHARLSLVILDLTMPDMNGAKTYEAIREISPTVKVLLSSGFTADGQAQELLDKGCAGFIQKPFDMNALGEKIQSIM